MNPKISIIVPVYNVEQYIHRCIDSILAQTFTDFELILIDDGAEDSSGKICDEYSIKDDRVRVIHKSNGGLSSARNAGIDIAKGDYIGFVDSDDWIEPNMYEVLYSNAISSSADLSVCNIFSMKEDKSMKAYCATSRDKLYSREEAMKELPTNKIITFSSCNKLFEKLLFSNLRYTEGIILEDMDLSYKIINKANKVIYSSKCLYNYRYNDSSILRTSFSLGKVDEYYVKKRMYEFYKEHYPEITNQVYFGLHTTGLDLYTNISLYEKEHLERYKFLIESDRKIISELIQDKEIEAKHKFKLILFLISPKLAIIAKKIIKKVRK